MMTPRRSAVLAVAVLTLFALSCGSACSMGAERVGGNTARVSIALPGPDHRLDISVDGAAIELDEESVGEPFLGTQDRTLIYRIGGSDPHATLRVVVRALPDGATIVFTRLEALRGSEEVVQRYALGDGELTFQGMDAADPQPPTKSPSVGYDRTTNPAGLVVMGRGDTTAAGVALVGKSFESRVLTHAYDDGSVSQVRELATERAGLGIDESGTRPALVLREEARVGYRAERYVLILPGPEPLGGLTPDELRRITIREFNWVTDDGTYAKLPWSIIPKTEDGYGIGLRAMRCQEVMDSLRAGESPVMRALLFNNIAALRELRSADGLWRTPYTSTWVGQKTQIHAPYVDTRHNGELALHVLSVSDRLAGEGIEDARMLAQWAEPFAGYLDEKARAGQVVRAGDGFYFHDYYDDAGTTHSHVSLNHALGEMNYLLLLYEHTGNERWLDLALSIKRAVDHTGEDWIVPSGDLHYQMNPDGTFGGTDYATVTLYDLRFSQTLFDRIVGARDPVFDTLIVSKEAFNASR